MRNLYDVVVRDDNYCALARVRVWAANRHSAIYSAPAWELHRLYPGHRLTAEVVM